MARHGNALEPTNGALVTIKPLRPNKFEPLDTKALSLHHAFRHRTTSTTPSQRLDVIEPMELDIITTIIIDIYDSGIATVARCLLRQ